MVGKDLPISEKTGTIIPYNYEKVATINGKKVKVLAKYDGSKDVILTLPRGMNMKDLSWLAIWGRKYRLNMGSVSFNGKDNSPVSYGKIELTILCDKGTYKNFEFENN